MNDVILNWKKLKKFIKSDKTENSINGKDRGYTDKEIQKILEFSDQRLKTAFLVWHQPVLAGPLFFVAALLEIGGDT